MSNNVPLPFPRPDFTGVRKPCNACWILWPLSDLTIVDGLCPDCIKIKSQNQISNKFPEAMNLKLQFACTRQGECDREFFCINPHGVTEDICPHLIAWDPLLKGERIKKEAQNGST